MADAGYATLYVTVGTEETGLWCDSCALPSLIRFPINGLGELRSGPVVMHLGNVLWCPECGTKTKENA